MHLKKSYMRRQQIKSDSKKHRIDVRNGRLEMRSLSQSWPKWVLIKDHYHLTAVEYSKDCTTLPRFLNPMLSFSKKNRVLVSNDQEFIFRMTYQTKWNQNLMLNWLCGWQWKWVWCAPKWKMTYGRLPLLCTCLHAICHSVPTLTWRDQLQDKEVIWGSCRSWWAPRSCLSST